MSAMRVPRESDRSADGTVQEAGGKHVLRFERRLGHPIDRVWKALTDSEEISGWLGSAEIDLVEGGLVTVRWLNPIGPEEFAKYGIDIPEELAGEQPVHGGTITRLDPPRVLEYDLENFGELRWELREEGPGSVLTFTHSLPAVEDHMVAQVLAGWHFHLDALEGVLAGRRIDWPNWPIERWAEHRDRYAAIVDRGRSR
jgi:uncharacterized protein YndB with AHSA1/START domain